MNVKLICMDMDGTLFADSEQVPEINQRALRECEARGIHLALVSGRGNAYLVRVAKRLGLNCAIASANGARIEASPEGPTIFEGVFDPEEGRKLFDFLYGLNVNFEAYAREYSFVVRADELPENHRASLMRNVANGDIQAVFDDERAAREAPGMSYKYVAFTKSDEAVARVRNALDAAGISHCSSGRHNVEIMPSGVGKGEAVRKLAEYFGVDISETMAFGDYTNDLSMLSASGHSVAMENGVQVLKDIAEIVAPPNTEGGLGQVICKYVLGENV